ncbi:MAG: hypothetical protein D6718_05260 [Acidobacteria bacterium]|nr:MAG: hypothetical protein D6718_05260 [Acidobacteriota bacterium]
MSVPSVWRRYGLPAALLVASIASGVAADPGGTSPGGVCYECHDDVAARVASGPHRGILAGSEAFCIACHGDPAAHLESGEAEDIVRGATLSGYGPAERSAACLSCHRRDFPGWDGAAHADEVSCWNCHAGEALHFETEAPAAPRRGEQDRGQLDRCWSCHGDVEAEFRLEYHHPVREGTVRCTDCHDIHGSEAAFESEESLSRRCTRCHTEQRGPFLYEHEAMSDGCTSCHRPHGSWNRDLVRSSGNAICLECHVQSNFPGIGKVNEHEFSLGGGARCWDCHAQVHGSNTNPLFNPRGRR